MYVWGEGGGGAEFLCITMGEIWNVYVQKFAYLVSSEFWSEQSVHLLQHLRED